MQNPLVSIVIPCHNYGHFLAETIESALRQTHRPFEILVVDDGSSDDTSEVAARFAEVQLVQQTNQGVAAARNAGFARSRGDYVLFLDADDATLGAGTAKEHAAWVRSWGIAPAVFRWQRRGVVGRRVGRQRQQIAHNL